MCVNMNRTPSLVSLRCRGVKYSYGCSSVWVCCRVFSQLFSAEMDRTSWILLFTSGGAFGLWRHMTKLSYTLYWSLFTFVYCQADNKWIGYISWIILFLLTYINIHVYKQQFLSFSNFFMFDNNQYQIYIYTTNKNDSCIVLCCCFALYFYFI